MTHRSQDRPAIWIGADEACEALSIKRATLYTYASRGLVRSVPDGRRKLYHRHDIESLRERSLARSGHEAVAAQALHWGPPVITSSVTEILGRSVRYRGRPIYHLLRDDTATFEAVAELLWTGELSEEPVTWPALSQRVLEVLDAFVSLPEEASPLEQFAAVLPRLAYPFGEDLDRVDVPEVMAHARGLVWILIEVIRRTFAPSASRGVAPASCAGATPRLAEALGLPDAPEEVHAALRAALIVTADHELNPSTFIARITASNGADLYRCVESALMGFMGPFHGRSCERLLAWFEEFPSADEVPALLDAQMREEGTLHGFSLEIYPEGDPRGEVLMEHIEEMEEHLTPRGLHRLAIHRAIIAGAHERLGVRSPRIDFALASLASVLECPAGSASAIFAVARIAGWVAHVLEQREEGRVLRPRARYEE